MLDPGDVQTQFDFPAARDRIEQAHAFKAGTALAFAAVGHHNVIKGRLFAAASSQPDRHHRKFTLQSLAANCNDNQGLRATNALFGRES